MKMIKNKSLRLLSITFVLVLAFCININAEEEKKDEGLKFPGKLGLELKTIVESGIKGAQPFETTDTAKGGNGGQVYMRQELKPSITFTPLKFLNIGVWLKDRIDFRMYDLAANDDTMNIKVRNRFYAGTDFIFIIDKVMTIAPGFEFRLNNDLNGTTTGTEVRLSPVLALSGKYDFGLSWKINALFEFYLYPAQYKFPNASIDDQKTYYGSSYWGSDKNKLFQKFQIEVDKISLGFEFLHFFAPKEIKCSIAYDMYLLATIYNPDYQNQYNDWFYKKVPDSSAKVVLNMMDAMKQYIGLNFELWGMIKPYIGFYSIISQTSGKWSSSYNEKSEFNLVGLYTEFRPGIKTGIDFKKDFFEMGIGYTGVILTASSDSLIAYRIAKADGPYSPKSYNWENYIYSYATFKF